MQSKWVQKSFSSGMRESSANTISLMGEDSTAVHCMLEYFYKGHYDPMREGVTKLYKHGSRSLLDVVVYSAADKYDVPGLATLAARNFHKELAVNWNLSSFGAV